MYPAWVYVAGIAAFWLMGSAPIFPVADSDAHGSRVEAIDGLRGLLALSVFVHHSAIYYGFVHTGVWALPPSMFYSNLGPAAVAMFFMITGFLFWSQMIKANGRPDFLSLYVGRLFRILPTYWVLVVMLVIGTGILSHWHLRVSLAQLCREVSVWMSGAIMTGQSINGTDAPNTISAWVTWTLHYEWIFYGSLLIIAFLARGRAALSLPALGIALSPVYSIAHHPFGIWTSDPDAGCIVLMFSIGMALAALPKGKKAPQWLASLLFTATAAIAVFGFRTVYEPVPILLLGAAFACVLRGATVFGLLRSAPAIRLGNISYAVYLLQGPILCAVLVPARAFDRSLGVHCAMCLLACVLLIMVSASVHAFVEKPGIAAGKRLVKRLRPASSVGRLVPEFR